MREDEENLAGVEEEKRVSVSVSEPYSVGKSDCEDEFRVGESPVGESYPVELTLYLKAPLRKVIKSLEVSDDNDGSGD